MTEHACCTVYGCRNLVDPPLLLQPSVMFSCGLAFGDLRTAALFWVVVVLLD